MIDVDHAVGRGVGAAVERLVEPPAAVDHPAPDRLAVPTADEERALFVGHEAERERPLVVVDVAVEDDVDLTRLEHRRQEPHLLLLEVLAGRVEPGVVEGDEPPGRVLGGGQVGRDPLFQPGSVQST